MQNSQLNRVLKLVRRTGDRLVVFDQETDAGYAIMDLDQYENLLEETDFNPLDLDLNDENDDDEFFQPRSAGGFEPVGSVIKDRWQDDAEEERAPWEGDWKEKELGAIDDGKTIEQSIEQKANRNEGASASETVPLNDVPHEEEEETFLLEPVE